MSPFPSWGKHGGEWSYSMLREGCPYALCMYVSYTLGLIQFYSRFSGFGQSDCIEILLYWASSLWFHALMVVSSS